MKSLFDESEPCKPCRPKLLQRMFCMIPIYYSLHEQKKESVLADVFIFIGIRKVFLMVHKQVNSEEFVVAEYCTGKLLNKVPFPTKKKAIFGAYPIALKHQKQIIQIVKTESHLNEIHTLR